MNELRIVFANAVGKTDRDNLAARPFIPAIVRTPETVQPLAADVDSAVVPLELRPALEGRENVFCLVSKPKRGQTPIVLAVKMP